MPNVAATERVATSPPAGLNLHPNPIPDLQLTTKLCSVCSRPLNVRDTLQRPMVPVGAARASICGSCGEESKAEGDRFVGRNRANSSNAPSQPIPLPLTSLSPNAVLTVALSSVSNDRGRPQFPQKSNRSPSQDAHSLSISPYSPMPASYFVSRMYSPSAHVGPLDLHTTTLEPLIDVTRLRVRSTGIGCLYPGETFLGIQTNQGKEHEVSVTIMVSGGLTQSCNLFVRYARMVYERTIARALGSEGSVAHQAASFHWTQRVPGSQWNTLPLITRCLNAIYAPPEVSRPESSTSGLGFLGLDRIAQPRHGKSHAIETIHMSTHRAKSQNRL